MGGDVLVLIYACRYGQRGRQDCHHSAWQVSGKKKLWGEIERESVVQIWDQDHSYRAPPLLTLHHKPIILPPKYSMTAWTRRLTECGIVLLERDSGSKWVVFKGASCVYTMDKWVYSALSHGQHRRRMWKWCRQELVPEAQNILPFRKIAPGALWQFRIVKENKEKSARKANFREMHGTNIVKREPTF